MDLAGYLTIARRWLLVIVAAVVLAAVAGYATASRLAPSYEAETRILIGPLSSDLNAQRASGQLAHTYAQLVTSYRVMDAAIRRLGVDVRAADLRNAITAIPNDVTRLVTIRVENRDPRIAATLANALADELAVLGAASGRPEGLTQVVDPAEAPSRPVAPQLPLMVLLAAFAGLLIAIASIVLIEYLRDSLSSPDELRELTGVAVLGELPTSRDPLRDLPSALLRTTVAERYRMMTLRVENSLGNNKVRTLLITSTRGDTDAAIVAVGLALGFADRGVATGLVDANLERPDATEILGLTPVADRDELITAGQVPISHVKFIANGGLLGQRRYLDLTVIPSGGGDDMGKLEQLQTVLRSIVSNAEVVVVTSPPADRSSDSLLWARLVDAVVLVVPPGTRRGDISSSVEMLRLAGVQLAGTILTKHGRLGRSRFRWLQTTRRSLGPRPRPAKNFVAAGNGARRTARRSDPRSPRIERPQ